MMATLLDRYSQPVPVAVSHGYPGHDGGGQHQHCHAVYHHTVVCKGPTQCQIGGSLEVVSFNIRSDVITYQ